MRYKTFSFPHDPEKLEITVKNRLGVAHCPGYGPVIQELGVQERVIDGEGAFFGPLFLYDYCAFSASSSQIAAPPCAFHCSTKLSN